MSSWPRLRQDSVALRPVKGQDSNLQFGWQFGWQVKYRLLSLPQVTENQMQFEILHCQRRHPIRIKKVSIRLDQEERLIEESLNLKFPPLAKWANWCKIYSTAIYFRPEQLVTIEVRYEVDEKTGPEDCHCDICEGGSPQADQQQPPLSPTTALCDDFRRLCLSPESSDVVFAIAEEEIPAHKLILATRLPYFKTLFASGMKESTSNRVVIDDIDAPAFKQVLKFIYCGDFPEDIDSAGEVYLPIAEKYGLRRLKEESAKAMEKGVTTENVMERVILAHLFQCSSLKKRCFQVLKEQPREDFRCEALERLKAHPDLLIDFMWCDPTK